MSKDEFDIFDGEELSNFEKLKAKYSGYGIDDEAIETINKNIERSAPDHDSFAEDFAGGFAEAYDAAEDESQESSNNGYYEEEYAEDEPADEEYEVPFSGEMEDIYSSSEREAGIEPADEEDEDAAEEQKPEFEIIEEDENPYAMYESIDGDEAGTENADEPEKEEIRNDGKKKKKKKSHKLRNTLLVLFIIAVIWGALFGVDLVLVSGWKAPFFCLKTDEYTNGSEDYMGLFYKIQFHVEENGDKKSVCLPWFVEGPNAQLERKNISDGKKPAEEKKTVSAEDNLTSVKITVPQEFIEEDLTEEGFGLTAEQKQQGFKSAELNKNKTSVTYEIGKGDYQNFLTQLKADTESSLQGLTQSPDYHSIKKVEYNEDFSSVSIFVDEAIYKTSLDRFCSVSVYNWVGYYQTFAQQKFNCEVVIKDASDGTVIEEAKG